MSLRVLHFGLSSSFGGIESFLLNLSRCCKRDIIFDYVSFCENPPKADAFSYDGNQIYTAPSRKKPIRYLRFLRGVISTKYDAIHIHKNTAIDFVPVIIARASGVKHVIVHSHNGAHHLSPHAMLIHKIGRAIINRCATERVACSDLAAYWMFGGNRDVEIINNGVEIDSFALNQSKRKAIRERYGVKPEESLVGCVGRLENQKNQTLLIDVMSEIASRRNDVRLILVGEGSNRSILENKVRTLGLSKVVFFAGQVSDVSGYMSAIDVLAMPSLYEGFPIAAIEAQCCGLPIVLSDRISHEVDIARVVRIDKQDKIEDWVEGIISLFGSRRNGKPSDFTEFSWEVVGERFSAIYES